MKIKTISYEQLVRAVTIAFENDKEIVGLYDPKIKVESVADVVEDVLRKIKEIGDIAIYKGVYLETGLIGYYVYQDEILISFCLNKQFRTRPMLREFFKKIKADLRKPFICSLWAVNQRAVRWLEKNKMKIVYNDNNIIQLVCQ